MTEKSKALLPGITTIFGTRESAYVGQRLESTENRRKNHRANLRDAAGYVLEAPRRPSRRLVSRGNWTNASRKVVRPSTPPPPMKPLLRRRPDRLSHRHAYRKLAEDFPF